MMKSQQPLVAQARRAVDFDPSGYTAFVCNGEPLGWLQPGFAELLRRWPEYFHVQPGRVRLHAALPTAQARTEALAQCTRALARDGHIHGWRDETYAIFPAAEGDEPVFCIERAAVRRFGLTARGVNLNAFVGAGAALRLWIARRSPAKPIDPGLLDNLVGGGIASGYGPWATLVKESAEEAGLAAGRVADSRKAGRLWSRHAVPEGVHSEILHVYDLALPADCTPANQDGEVSAVRLADIPEVMGWLAAGQFSLEPALVTLDFLLRHGLIAPGHPEFAALEKILACRRLAP
jgi:8-oxo-dGTP pyrophosphatase MutT (NUDIX family)